MITLELYVGTEIRTIRVKSCHELTIQDWKDLTPIEDKPGEFDHPMFDLNPGQNRLYKTVEIFTGLTQEELDRVKTGAMREISKIIGDHLALAKKGSDEFQKACLEDNGWTPPKKISIAGKSFTVPQEIDKDTVWGQWIDWSAWKAPEHEADLVAEVLLFMLVEEGKEYGSFGQEKVDIIMQCPMMSAFEMCAFFFDKSAEFRSITDQRFSLFRMSMKHILSTALKIMQSSTGELTS